METGFCLFYQILYDSFVADPLPSAMDLIGALGIQETVDGLTLQIAQLYLPLAAGTDQSGSGGWFEDVNPSVKSKAGCRADGSSGQLNQGLSGHSIRDPLCQLLCPHFFIKFNRWAIPIQHHPL